ncbi:hypothetical protein VAE122_2970129 [Vibrio aestuarianus]|nr:hypothetical protein VAE122_2970129 [Vibrio aestuarianus]
MSPSLNYIAFNFLFLFEFYFSLMLKLMTFIADPFVGLLKKMLPFRNVRTR